MRIIIAAILFTSITGCAGIVKTDAVSLATALPVPKVRAIAYQEEIAGYSKLVIIRDAGFLGGGCFLAIEIERTLAARLDPGEGATFFVKPGMVEVSVAPDPGARGLCAMGFDPVREKYDLQPAQPTVFRLSSRQYRRPELEPYN